jgi:hypothetical protein
MPDLRKQEDERSKEHWAFVEATAHKVGNWPLWKQAAALTAIETERQKEAEERKLVGSAYAAD